VSATVKAACRSVAGQATPDVISARVVALAEGVTKAMFLTKLKIALVLLCLASALGTGAAILSYGSAGGGPAEQFAKAAPGVLQNQGEDKKVLADPERLKKARVVLRVKWLQISPPGGNPSDTVELLEIIKNESDVKWGKKVRIDYEPGKKGVPHDECTVYLEINEKLKGKPWALMGGGAVTGVSHVGKQNELPPEPSLALIARPEYKWLARSLREIETIKPGMTRADLLKVFEEEGGISTRSQRTYVYRDCALIKVDVTFEAVGMPEDKLAESPKDRITKISRAYLGWHIVD